MACGILVPWPGIEPTPLSLEIQSLNHWAAREDPNSYFLFLWRRFCSKTSSVHFSEIKNSWQSSSFPQLPLCHWLLKFYRPQKDPLCEKTHMWTYTQNSGMNPVVLGSPKPIQFRRPHLNTSVLQDTVHQDKKAKKAHPLCPKSTSYYGQPV